MNLIFGMLPLRLGIRIGEKETLRPIEEWEQSLKDDQAEQLRKEIHERFNYDIQQMLKNALKTK